MKKTGIWYKVRAWDAMNVTWKQYRTLHESAESAESAAKKMAKKTGARVQAIRLEKAAKGASVEIVFDSGADS